MPDFAGGKEKSALSKKPAPSRAIGAVGLFYVASSRLLKFSVVGFRRVLGGVGLLFRFQSVPPKTLGQEGSPSTFLRAFPPPFVLQGFFGS